MMGLRISRTIAGGILALVLLSPTVAAAGPVTIVDTGQGTSTWAALVGIRPAGGGLPEAEQWLAGEFLVASPVTITSIEGWMYVDQSGQLAVKVYSDGKVTHPVVSCSGTHSRSLRIGKPFGWVLPG